MTRVLAIGREAPWLGPRSGLPIRRGALLRGAAGAGDLDYVMLSPTRPDRVTPPPEVGKVVHVPTTTRPTGARGHLGWQLDSAVHVDAPPYELSRRALADPGRALVTIGQLCAEHDVVWLLDKHAAFLVGSLVRASLLPAILDIEELVAGRARQEAALLRAVHRGGLDARARTRARVAFLERNALAWERWTPRLAALASVCTVSNPGDADGFEATRTVVVPNGCDVPQKRDPRPGQAARPVVLFHGLMSYEPNADGAEHLVRDVLPQLVRALGRDLELRIVGRSTAAVDQLARVDRRVTVTGYVEDIGAEIEAADVVVVPLRIGSGTRLKILEAMAMCTPVVSTSVGCSGLDVVDGEHLLVADAPDVFAAACARLLGDQALRAHLVDRAYDFVAARYDWRVIEADVAELTRAQVPR